MQVFFRGGLLAFETCKTFVHSILPNQNTKIDFTTLYFTKFLVFYNLVLIYFL